MSKRRRFELKGRAWERVRRAALERDGWRCVTCGKYGRMQVDHKIPKWKGGPLLDLDNLQSLCYGCHLAKSQGERTIRPDRPGYREKWAALMEVL